MASGLLGILAAVGVAMVGFSGVVIAVNVVAVVVRGVHRAARAAVGVETGATAVAEPIPIETALTRRYARYA